MILPKVGIPLTKGQRIRYISSTISTTPLSLKTTFVALGISSPSFFWVANDSASAVDLKVGDSASQPIAIGAGGDIGIPTQGDDVYVSTASGTATFYIICIGT